MATVGSEKVGQVQIVGKILATRKAGQMFETLVVMAAPDAYSHPQTVALLSKSRLGQPEEEFKGSARLGGFSRSYKTTDTDTGEVRQVKTAENKLYVD